MIARMWQARTGGPRATERYHQVFETEVAEALRGVAGFRGAYLLARQAGESMEIRTLTLFTSLDDVIGFAGEDHERERVTPAARETLLESDPLVRHFDVVADLAQ